MIKARTRNKAISLEREKAFRVTSEIVFADWRHHCSVELAYNLNKQTWVV